MRVIAQAGTFTPSDGAEPNHWIVHLDSDDLSVGTYSIPAGGLDDQTPHTEDEIYVVRSGRATLVTSSGHAEVGPGHAGDELRARRSRAGQCRVRPGHGGAPVHRDR
jgi:hypothetical protein